ncbi:MAG: hypothetical protein CM15mP3_02990 [Candidatus Poseidoniales archaeon]|nr:MAG: hypothetical protein CM15mP3_02990 [Candidatus Poseidoniales archaeon]
MYNLHNFSTQLSKDIEVEYLSETSLYMSSETGCNANRNDSLRTVGLIYCTGEMQSGYTLFSPMASATPPS